MKQIFVACLSSSLLSNAPLPLTLGELVLVGDVTACFLIGGLGQHHAPHMAGVDFDWLQSPISVPGVEHHITIHLQGEGGRHDHQNW